MIGERRGDERGRGVQVGVERGRGRRWGMRGRGEDDKGKISVMWREERQKRNRMEKK